MSKVIVICASMSAAKKAMEVKSKLMASGYEVIIPKNIEKYADGSLAMESAQESAQNKIREDLIRDYFNEIKKVDAVLVVNQTKNNIENYIGGNSFLEMGFAHVLNKELYILNGIPEVAYKDEIIAMQPVILNGDLGMIE